MFVINLNLQRTCTTPLLRPIGTCFINSVFLVSDSNNKRCIADENKDHSELGFDSCKLVLLIVDLLRCS